MEKVIDNPANASSIDKGGSTTDIEGSSSFQSEKVIDNPANASSIDKGGSTTDIEGSSSFQSEQSPARIPRLNRK